MSAATFLSERKPDAPLGLGNVRVSGGVSIHCQQRLGDSRIIDTHERDGYKVRSPRRSNPPEAVLINTGGGIAAGDHAQFNFAVDEAASLTITTLAAERCYRSGDGDTARISVAADVGPEATFSWLPQETILFDDARLAINLATTVFEQGGTIVNYAEVTSLLKDDDGVIDGVVAHDLESDEELTIRGRIVVNATGPFADSAATCLFVASEQLPEITARPPPRGHCPGPAGAGAPAPCALSSAGGSSRSQVATRSSRNCRTLKTPMAGSTVATICCPWVSPAS